MKLKTQAAPGGSPPKPPSTTGVPPGSPPNQGPHRAPSEGQPPGPAGDVGTLAQRGAEALERMRVEDRDAIMEKIPGTPRQIAEALTGGGALHQRLLQRKASELERMIRLGPLSGTTAAAGSRVADFRAAVSDMTELGTAPHVRQTAQSLAAMVQRAGATPEDFGRLVGRLELLADLQGKGDLRMVSDPKLRARIAQLSNGKLRELAGAVGRELAQLAYDPLKRRAQSEGIT